MYPIFRLTQKQIGALRKYKGELEIERNVAWHEGQIVSSEIFREVLASAGFEEGNDLSLDELRELSEQLREGIGSTALAVKGSTSMFEANDLKVFNERMRDLLYSEGNLPDRVDAFIDLKQVGLQTVGQFLCKFDYEKYAFVAYFMFDVFEALSITENQLEEARQQSIEEFGLKSEGLHRRTYKYFQFFVVLREIKDTIKLKDYLEVQNLLWRISKRLDEGEKVDVEPPPTEHFILQTGGGEYEDEPESRYQFKEGIPGSLQLRNAENRGKFVYYENGKFYGKGEIGDITSYEKDGVTYYDKK